jgi:hypothetical protein
MAPNNSPISLSQPIDHTVFGTFDCGIIAKDDISMKLGGIMNPNFDPTLCNDQFMIFITHEGGEDFKNAHLYPELIEFNRLGNSPYNGFLHELIHDTWNNVPIHITIHVAYKTAPTGGCFDHKYGITVFFNNILVYKHVHTVKKNYKTKGPIFIANDLQRRYLASLPVPVPVPVPVPTQL